MRRRDEGRDAYLPAGAIDPGREQSLSAPPALKVLQDAVGGYIEAVPGFNCLERGGKVIRCVAYCNEEGKLHGLAPNHAATRLWDRALPAGLRPSLADVLVGPIVILFGDRDFMEML